MDHVSQLDLMERIYLNYYDAQKSTKCSRFLDRSVAAMGKRIILVQNCGYTTAGPENKSLTNMMDHVGVVQMMPW